MKKNLGKEIKAKKETLEILNCMDLKSLYLEDIEEIVLKEFKKRNIELNYVSLQLVGVNGSLKEYSLVVGNSYYREDFYLKFIITTQVPTFANFYNILSIN